jgi:hypothetical protein
VRIRGADGAIGIRSSAVAMSVGAIAAGAMGTAVAEACAAWSYACTERPTESASVRAKEAGRKRVSGIRLGILPTWASAIAG